ncbi:hypothetical protein HELRODRAFT_86965 [Helobdella robusta]|uniref:Vacuolar protein sorting-associated protein 33A n=1 Tax=Helobdella robusta TaxID=6412 RepID=T1G6K0_HELRO|nr:hypothetical protein HELRODRAFT_86965 [Helobdella robusta]ESN95294.1 hypothetical protein HELRODRAFT_86965 [Helobdella robusta]
MTSKDKINCMLFREVYRKELKDWLNTINQTKTIVWDETLISTFDLIANFSFLKENGVDQMIFLNSDIKASVKSENVIFIVQPKLHVMDKIAYIVKKHENMLTSLKKNFHVLFIPRKSLLCEKRLKDLDVVNSLTSIDELAFDIYPLETDLLSMEWNTCFRECYLDSNHTCLFHVAKSIMLIQSLFGIIPNVVGKGDLADSVIEMVLRMRRELGSNEPLITPKIDTLLLVDRIVDPLTPLLTQLTYEGLVDELFSISKGIVKLPANKFKSESSNADTAADSTSTNPFATSTDEVKKIHLNSSDELFADLRDKNFNAVGNALNQRVKVISAQYNERLAAKTVGEMKQFVSKIPHIQAAKAALATHTTIAEMVKGVTDSDEFRDFVCEQQECLKGLDLDKSRSFIEKCILMKEDINKVLRLICLQCYCNNGLKPKILEFYKKEIIQVYGFEHVISLCNLERVGLLFNQSINKTFPTIKKTLKLLVKDANEQMPEDISYVYSGYRPMSVRLLELHNKPGWRSIEEIVNNMLPGAVREEFQQMPAWLKRKKGLCFQKVVLVFFIGGVTFAEISALRFLSQIDDSLTEYVVATTNMISGPAFISSLSDTLHSKPANPFA